MKAELLYWKRIVVVTVITMLGSQHAHAYSFWDSGKVYTIFGFTFCFPTCPYISAAERAPMLALVDPPPPR
jgi:hypothetical protein